VLWKSRASRFPSPAIKK